MLVDVVVVEEDSVNDIRVEAGVYKLQWRPRCCKYFMRVILTNFLTFVILVGVCLREGEFLHRDCICCDCAFVLAG